MGFALYSNFFYLVMFHELQTGGPMAIKKIYAIFYVD